MSKLCSQLWSNTARLQGLEGLLHYSLAYVQLVVYSDSFLLT